MKQDLENKEELLKELKDITATHTKMYIQRLRDSDKMWKLSERMTEIKKGLKIFPYEKPSKV